MSDELKLYVYEDSCCSWLYYADTSYEEFVNNLLAELYQQRFEEEGINSKEDVLREITDCPYSGLFEYNVNGLLTIYSEEKEGYIEVTTEELLKGAHKGQYLGCSD